MKIITLTENEFTNYASVHKYRNIYQTIEYAKTMKPEGYDYHLLGFNNNSNELIGATVILIKRVFLNYKMAYAPYGFLIDYSNSDLIEELTDKLKKLLIQQRFIYIKINPLIYCSKRNKKGEIVSYNPEINDILEIMQNNDYIHYGYTTLFDTVKPRWEAIVNLTASNDILYKNLNKQVRNKIRKAEKYGIEIIKGSHDDIDILYEFIKRKHKKSIKYYKNLLNNYGEMAEIHFAKINTEKYVTTSKDTYEKELEINSNYNEELQELSKKGKNITTTINKKMESDKRLSIYQNNLIHATMMLDKYPDGLIIGGIIIIKYQNGVNMVIEGFNKQYSSFNCNYLLKWELIKKANLDGFNYFNLNGIVGEFNEKNKYSGLNEMKLGYGANAMEYIGEFDLIINSMVYNIYNKKQKK